jgi:hypothetical protein
MHFFKFYGESESSSSAPTTIAWRSTALASNAFTTNSCALDKNLRFVQGDGAKSPTAIVQPIQSSPPTPPPHQTVRFCFVVEVDSAHFLFVFPSTVYLLVLKYLVSGLIEWILI